MNCYKVLIIALILGKNNSEILLSKRNRDPELGKWSLPGGAEALNSEKDPSKAISKEVFSEFSVKFENHKLLNVIYDVQNEILRMYYVGNILGDVRITQPEITGETKWFSFGEALELDLAFGAFDKEAIKYFRNNFKF